MRMRLTSAVTTRRCSAPRRSATSRDCVAALNLEARRQVSDGLPSKQAALVIVSLSGLPQNKPIHAAYSTDAPILALLSPSLPRGDHQSLRLAYFASP